MTEYIYFVKCPDCDDESFLYFDEAKDFATSCLSRKPIITQTEVQRNDFGECTDHCDLGTVWSWEDAVGDVTCDEPTTKIFTSGDFREYNPDCDPEFTDLDNTFDAFSDLDIVPDNFRRPMQEDFDFNKAAAQCSRKCYDFYKALASKAPQREINKYGKTAYKFVEDQYGLIDDEAEELLWRGYVIWKQLNEEITSDFSTDDQIKTWVCWYEGNDIGTVEAATKEEAEEAMMDQFPEYQYNNTDWKVEEVIDEACKRKPIPEGMTIEQLVEEMEENEDEVECTWCNDLFDKSECRKEVNLGYLCSRCEAAIKSRGETLTFVENNYWDFLDEDVSLTEATTKWTCYFDDRELGVIDADNEEMALEKMQQVFPENNYGEYDGCFWVEPAEA
jgi:hypothetical protein